MRFVTSMCAILLLSAGTGCASYTPPVAAGDRVESGYGYVYGRFTLDKLNPGKTGHLRAGLVVERTDHSASYTIEFSQRFAPAAIAVKPGMYWLTKVTFASWDYEKEGEKEIPPGPLTVPFTVEPGKAYYLADFEMSANFYSTGTHNRHEWKPVSIADNYQGTTGDLKTALPQLSGVSMTRALGQ